jgi:transaldolase
MNPLLALKQQGQSHWKDDLRRGMFQDGSLRHRVHEEGLTSVISNPAICNLAIAGNDWCVSDVGVGALDRRCRCTDTRICLLLKAS